MTMGSPTDMNYDSADAFDRLIVPEGCAQIPSRAVNACWLSYYVRQSVMKSPGCR